MAMHPLTAAPTRRRYIFINRYFFPDHSATAQILADLTFYLSTRGHDIIVLTSRQRYDQPAARLAARESVEGVGIIRLLTTRFGRRRLALRVFDYATFYLSAAWRLLRLARTGDVVIMKTDPPMLSAVLWPVLALRRVGYVNWLQDLFPETAAALGVAGVGGWRLRWAKALRNVGLRRAQTNVCIGRLMARYLQGLQVEPQRIEVIGNWSDGGAIQPLRASANSLRREWGLNDRLVIGYSGNLGRAHPIAAMQAAIAASQDKADLCFLFIGGGAGMDQLKAWVQRQGFANVMFKPYQDRAMLGQSLSLPDLHIASLKPELEGFIVPSKIYGIAAAGRPCLFIGDPKGEIGAMLAENEAGISVPDDPESVVAAVQGCLADRAILQRMGANARHMFERHSHRDDLCLTWEKLLSRVAQEQS